jgi:Integrase zinc binding domain
LDGYTQDTRLSKVIDVLKEEQQQDMMKTKLPYTLENDLLYSTGNTHEKKLCIPRPLVQEIFEIAHDDAGHQGFARSYERLNGLSIYKGSRLLKQYINSCPHYCAQYTSKRHKPYGSLQPIMPPPIPFHTIAIDFILALPTSREGSDQTLTITDKFTKQNGIVHGKSSWSAEEWGEALVRHL